jgi:hypothetical protein
MRFANPLSVECPTCGTVSNPKPRDLVALEARCSCGASLEKIGREMRAELTNWNAYVARIELALGIEKIYDLEIGDEDLERMSTPSDMVAFVSRAMGGQARVESIAEGITAELGRLRGSASANADLGRQFFELFEVREHG